MNIRWTQAAAADLQKISDYLRENQPNFRVETMRRIYRSIQALKQWPRSGRIGCEEGTRELPLSPLPYVAIYRVREQAVEVLRIYHGARER